MIRLPDVSIAEMQSQGYTPRQIGVTWRLLPEEYDWEMQQPGRIVGTPAWMERFKPVDDRGEVWGARLVAAWANHDKARRLAATIPGIVIGVDLPHNIIR